MILISGMITIRRNRRDQQFVQCNEMQAFMRQYRKQEQPKHFGVKNPRFN